MLGSDADLNGGVDMVWGHISCEFCLEDPHRPPGDAEPFIGPARWAVVVKDCCHGNTGVDYVICDGHWTLYRDRLVGTCAECGTVARHYTDSVWTVEQVGPIPVGFTVRRRHWWTRRRRS